MSATNENRPSNVWDEKLWAFANIKAARDFGINTASELNNKAAEIIGLNTEQKAERAKNDKLRHVVTSEWSRTDLKNKGLIINESRGNGIWRLTQTGLQISCNTYETFLIDYKQIFKRNTMNYISQEIISDALKNILFNDSTKGGSATTRTSLIFQTLAFHAAITSKRISFLEIKAGKEGRKRMTSEYANLVGRSLISPGEDGENGYLSSLGTKNGEGFQIKTNKNAAGVLSSNFLTNVSGRNPKYADFVYNETNDRLTSNPLLTEFRAAIAELEPGSLESLIVLSLRCIEIKTESLPLKIEKDILVNIFGAAGEALWSMLPKRNSINVDSLDPKIAVLEPETLIAKATHTHTDYPNRLVSSLASKPFLILAGGTGTGKTRVAKLIAASIAGTANVEVVAVGADWTDNRPLLGFRNLLVEDGKTYVAPPALRIILKALDNPGNPYFLILDEMNLSHVERYFADFLSSMESKDPLKLHDSAVALSTEDGVLVKGKIDWPRNIFVIGTVNIDETTYMFSPKVLDRAHVIEFKVSWDEIATGLEGAVPSELPALHHEQVKEFMRVSHLTEKALPEEDYELLTEVLEDLHAALVGTRFVFAHRTARECLNFIASSQALAKADIIAPQENTSLIDLAILQKALPKLNGASGTLSKVLEELIKVSDKHDLELCKEKLESMSKQLKADQFVSFIQ